MFPETNLSKFQAVPKTIVILKETGLKVALDKRSEFNSNLHEWPTTVVEPEGKARFAELKAKKWSNLNGEERKEYSALKPLHG